MSKLKKVYDETFPKGAIKDDMLNNHIIEIVTVSHKPTDEESELVNGDVGEFSYSTILEKKVRIVVYIEQ